MISIKADGPSSVVIVEVIGDLGENLKDSFENELHPIVCAPGETVLLDLSRSRFINSAGIALLVSLVARANMNGCEVVLVSPSPFVMEVLERTRLTSFFNIRGRVRNQEQVELAEAR